MEYEYCIYPYHMTSLQNTKISNASVEGGNTMVKDTVKDVTELSGDQKIKIKLEDTTKKHVIRDLHRCIYTSSYDRGLHHTLEMWPAVKKIVPEATLHIFYGWQLFDEFTRGNPASLRWKEKMLEMMKYEGVFEHGRIAQPELVDEYKKSGIWVYSTSFGEINCISAIKAQAYGCEPVVVNYAALQETVQFGKKVEGDIYDQETKDKFLEQLIDSLLHPMSEDKREKMMQWAQEKYSWDVIAQAWKEEFNG